MKSRVFLTILSLFCVACAWSQAVQKVLVLEYNMQQKKTPLANVEVSVSNAGSTTTDANGAATLRFRTLKEGEAVQVRRIQKQGYEIFNKDAVSQWSVSNDHTFTVILCKTDNFRQLCDNYTRVASASYEAQYKKEQSRLSAERKAGKLKQQEYEKQLQQLEDHYAEQLENLENYIDHFARIDLSELSAQEQAIIELVQQGKIDDAIAKYEELDLLSKYRQQTSDIQQISTARDSLKAIRDEKQQAADSLKVVIDLFKKNE